jgi:hypothetical protein
MSVPGIWRGPNFRPKFCEWNFRDENFVKFSWTVCGIQVGKRIVEILNGKGEFIFVWYWIFEPVLILFLNMPESEWRLAPWHQGRWWGSLILPLIGVTLRDIEGRPGPARSLARYAWGLIGWFWMIGLLQRSFSVLHWIIEWKTGTPFRRDFLRDIRYRWGCAGSWRIACFSERAPRCNLVSESVW